MSENILKQALDAAFPPKPPTSPDETIRRLAAKAKFKTAAYVLTDIRGRQKQYNALVARLDALAMDRTNINAIAARASSVEDLIAGKNVVAGSKAQVRIDQRETSRALKAAIAEVVAGGVQVVRPEAERFVTEAIAYIDKIEAGERETATELGLSYTPSATVTQLRRLVSRVLDRLPEKGLEGLRKPADLIAWEQI